MKAHRIFFLVLGMSCLILGFQNCSNTKFSTDPAASEALLNGHASGDDANIGHGNLFGDDASVTAGTVPGNDASISCPLKVTNILVIDMKSGWWEGDGSGTFGNIAKQINDQCGQIVLEYGHVTTQTLNVGNFPSKSFNDYEEIWILSGADDDPEDIRLSSATFQRFLTGIMGSSANLFLGTGNGAIYHTNAITKALGYGDLVLAGGQSFIALTSATGNKISYVTQITKSQMQAGHPLFTNVQSLPDTTRVNGANLVSDKLVSHASFDYLITNSAGVRQVGSINHGGRKIILEANLGRMYGILNGDVNVRNYMVNLMTTLRK